MAPTKHAIRPSLAIPAWREFTHDGIRFQAGTPQESQLEIVQCLGDRVGRRSDGKSRDAPAGGSEPMVALRLAMAEGGVDTVIAARACACCQKR